MTQPLKGRRALVTGGARRIGRVIAHRLAAEGAAVAVQYRTSRDEAESLRKELERYGAPCRLFHADFEAPGGYEGLIGDVAGAMGGLDILVNNASIFPESTVRSLAWDDLLINIRVNAWAPFCLSRAFCDTGRTGAIVNILDTRIGAVTQKHVAYSLSKEMLHSFTRILALEYSPRFRVNGVAPGLILPPEGKDDGYLERLSQTTPLRRPGAPADIAGAVLFLITNEYMTGQVLRVDGGWSLTGAPGELHG